MCVCDPKGLLVNQVLPMMPEAHTGLAAAFHFSLGILTWMLCSQHWCKVFETLGRWSELFTVIISCLHHMLFLKYIYTFILETKLCHFGGGFTTKQLCSHTYGIFMFSRSFNSFMKDIDSFMKCEIYTKTTSSPAVR